MIHIQRIRSVPSNNFLTKHVGTRKAGATSLKRSKFNFVAWPRKRRLLLLHLFDDYLFSGYINGARDF